MILSVIMIGVLGAGVALFVLWRQATIERDTAQSEKLASEATGNLNSDPELGVLLALQAIKIRETPQAVTALAELIPAVREIRTYQLGNTEASWASSALTVMRWLLRLEMAGPISTPQRRDD